jgi:glutamine amidotransferase
VSGVVIIDSGGANLASVRGALRRLGVDAPVTLDPAAIAAAERLILPGVGAAAPIMQRLRGAGIADMLQALRTPLLGICVGMQVLFEHSAEGETACLGLLPGRVRRMTPEAGVRVPHMGWNRLRRERDSPLLEGIDASAAYFVHSYAAPVDAACVASVEHGQRYAALVERGHIAGAQFHPERSAQAGARLLANFLRWQPA